MAHLQYAWPPPPPPLAQVNFDMDNSTGGTTAEHSVTIVIELDCALTIIEWQMHGIYVIVTS